MRTMVPFWLFLLLGLAQAQITIVTHRPSCYGECLVHVQDDPVLDYQEEECNSPFYSGTNTPSDYDQRMTSYLRCHCTIPGMLQRKACCIVDSCHGDDGFFSFDCGVSSTWIRCGRDRDTNLLQPSGASGTTSGATTATASEDPEATETGAPSSGQSAAGPNETGNADESGNDSDGDDGGNSGARTIGLGVGLGVGIPLVLLGAGVLGFCVWRTKRQQAGNQYSQPPLPEQQTPDRWTTPNTFMSGNGAENKHMSELMGGQMGQRYELSPDTNRTSEMP